MTDVDQKQSGKTHRDENFPVASWLIRSRHRAPILAFYNFVRAADDIADNPALTMEQKIAQLDRFEEDLTGGDGDDPRATALRRALTERNIDDRHALDLLKAFRLDATKRRYANWDELMAYCELSAMPVGRFVLDLHEESPETWPASDALCAALQIINHLQDCGADYRVLDRVYLPLDVLERHAADVEALGAPSASPELRATIADLARRAEGLLGDGQQLAASIADWRLGLEISVIHSLASRLAQMLTQCDPLAEETHIGKVAAGGIAFRTIISAVAQRVGIDNRRSSLGALL
jgi:squalene synthase HpnC